MKYKELIHMINDELKLESDDSYFTLDHIQFLCNKYRARILKAAYDTKVKKPISESAYQTICLSLEEANPNGEAFVCDGGTLLRSKETIPALIPGLGEPLVYPLDFYNGDRMTYVSRNRMKFVGHNKWLRTIIYCSLHPDGHLYFTSANPQFRFLKKARITGIFEDADAASELEWQSEGKQCDIMEREYPIEAYMVPTLVGAVVKELLGVTYRPEDSENNASDDMSNLATFIHRNVKSNLQRQIENQ